MCWKILSNLKYPQPLLPCFPSHFYQTFGIIWWYNDFYCGFNNVHLLCKDSGCRREKSSDAITFVY